jgi:hypothetical protein
MVRFLRLIDRGGYIAFDLFALMGSVLLAWIGRCRFLMLFRGAYGLGLTLFRMIRMTFWVDDFRRDGGA